MSNVKNSEQATSKTNTNTINPTFNTPVQVRQVTAMWRRNTQRHCPVRYARQFAEFVADDTRRLALFHFMLIRSLRLDFTTEQGRARYIENELHLIEHASDFLRALMPEPKAERKPNPQPKAPVYLNAFWQMQEPSEEVLAFIDQHPHDWQDATFADLFGYVEGGTSACSN